MKLCLLLVLLTTCAYAQTAQTADPLSVGLKGGYTTIKNNLIKSAEKMPEEHYSFKPNADMQSFAQRLAHIADANLRTCASIGGEQKSVGAAAKTSKNDIVAALKESFAYCDTVFDSMKDADAAKMVNTGRAQAPKLQALWGMVVHDNTIYGSLAVYMRLKGIIPPSSETR